MCDCLSYLNLEWVLTLVNFGFVQKDAIDLLQGHYIVAVSRDTAPVPQKGGLEAVAVSIHIKYENHYHSTFSSYKES